MMAKSKLPKLPKPAPTAPGPAFGERLRDLRARAGLSQAQLADLAGKQLARYLGDSAADLHINTIKNLEQGRAAAGPQWATVMALADALGVEVTEFLPPGHKRQARQADPADVLAAEARKLAVSAAKLARQ